MKEECKDKNTPERACLLLVLGVVAERKPCFERSEERVLSCLDTLEITSFFFCGQKEWLKPCCYWFFEAINL